MTKNAARAYAEWQQADIEARKAESRLKAWLGYDMGGEAPARALLVEVSKLRAIANEKLKAAVGALSA